MAAVDKVILETALEGVEAKNIANTLESHDVNSVLQEAYLQKKIEEKEKERKAKVLELIKGAARLTK